MHGGWFAYFAALLLAAGVVGFLPFNFPRARIFMGDVGSQFCGFVLAVLAVVASRFEGVELSFLIVPMLLSGVLFDVAFTLARRLLAGERITEAHRGHLYQVAVRTGVPAWAVTLIHAGFAAFGGLVALLFIAVPVAAKPFVSAADAWTAARLVGLCHPSLPPGWDRPVVMPEASGRDAARPDAMSARTGSGPVERASGRPDQTHISPGIAASAVSEARRRRSRYGKSKTKRRPLIPAAQSLDPSACAGPLV